MPALSENQAVKFADSEVLARTLWSGLTVGDALGAPVEFSYTADITALFPEGVNRMADGIGLVAFRKAGEVTDDSQMAFCLHRSLQYADGWNPKMAKLLYMQWLSTNPPDVGLATCSALLGDPDMESQGNGALMRVMPLALWALENPGVDWESAVREDAAITHPHPVNGDANAVYVYALMQAVQEGATPRSVYESTLAWAKDKDIHPAVQDVLRRAATERPDYDGECSGWVLKALQSAFYQLLHAPDFKSALVDIVSSGGDTDTNAAIAGPLLAAIYGPACIPTEWLDKVREANANCYAQLILPPATMGDGGV